MDDNATCTWINLKKSREDYSGWCGRLHPFTTSSLKQKTGPYPLRHVSQKVIWTPLTRTSYEKGEQEIVAAGFLCRQANIPPGAKTNEETNFIFFKKIKLLGPWGGKQLNIVCCKFWLNDQITHVSCLILPFRLDSPRAVSALLSFFSP